MKYASQINIVVVIVALVAVGYAVSQTIWKLPVTPSVEAGGAGLADVSSREGSEAPVSSEIELPGRENLRRQSQSSRSAVSQPNREPEGGSRVSRPATPPPQRTPPPSSYPEESSLPPGGPKIISTRPGFAAQGEDPVRGSTGTKRMDESEFISRTIEERKESGGQGAPSRMEQGPGGSALPQDRADPSATGAKRNRQPPPPPARSSNR